MARIQVQNQDATDEIQVRSQRFSRIEPGIYFARVTKCELGQFEYPEGRWNMKLTPEFVIFNDNDTTINRQDIVCGVQAGEDNPMLISTREDVPALYSWASNFMAALGFTRISEFAPELVCGQVIRLAITNETYEVDGSTRTKNAVDLRTFTGVGEYLEALAEVCPDAVQAGNMYFASQEDATTYEELLEVIDDDDDEAL